MNHRKEDWLQEIAGLILDIQRVSDKQPIGKMYFGPVVWSLFRYQVNLAGQILCALKHQGLDYIAVLGAGALYEACISQIWIMLGNEQERDERAKAYWEYQNMALFDYYKVGRLSKEDMLKKARKHLSIFIRKNRKLSEDEVLNPKNYYNAWYECFDKKWYQLEEDVAAGDLEVEATFKSNYAVYCQYKHGDPIRVIPANPILGKIENKNRDWMLASIMTLGLLAYSAQKMNDFFFHSDVMFWDRLQKFVPTDS